MKKLKFKIFINFLIVFTVIDLAYAVRIKDITSIKGVRINQLVGYGLVVGLNGTGDKSGADFTMQSIANMMERMGVHVDKNQIKVKNVAAVMITATMPPFAKIGTRLDVTISSLGDAKSLAGGTLLLTPLKGVDGKVYAIAQGSVGVGGIGASQNHVLVATIPEGATIEREIPFSLSGKSQITFTLSNPDFTTALRITEIVNTALGEPAAKALDSGTIKIEIPEAMRPDVAKFIANIETLEVEPDTTAKVIVNEKTGTVVIGENVKISTIAISHGDLSIKVQDTSVTPPKQVDNRVMLVPTGTTIGDLVKALNAVGVSPKDLISIFQSIKAAGALQADLEII
ncbi:MAG: flagellar basal body P-ring protein FlgI [Desulfobacterales bacterium]|nr:flagellar basal body P-ring protein FlgI [Desulfobacterales bacterium]